MQQRPRGIAALGSLQLSPAEPPKAKIAPDRARDSSPARSGSQARPPARKGPLGSFTTLALAASGARLVNSPGSRSWSNNPGDIFAALEYTLYRQRPVGRLWPAYPPVISTAFFHERPGALNSGRNPVHSMSDRTGKPHTSSNVGKQIHALDGPRAHRTGPRQARRAKRQMAIEKTHGEKERLVASLAHQLNRRIRKATIMLLPVVDAARPVRQRRAEPFCARLGRRAAGRSSRVCVFAHRQLPAPIGGFVRVADLAGPIVS